MEGMIRPDSISLHFSPKLQFAKRNQFSGKTQNEVKSESEEISNKYSNLKRKFSALRDVSLALLIWRPRST